MTIEVLVALLGAAVMLAIVGYVGIHNRLTRVYNHIRESWSNIDVQLKRRHSLIPNLVAVAQRFAEHEQDLFESVAKAREQAAGRHQSLGEQAVDENNLAQQASLLLAKMEAYPKLRSDDHFQRLQRELANTEDRIAAARRFYNANVRAYNTLLETFPSSLVATKQGRHAEEYFEVESVEVRRVLPPVQLGP